MLKILYEPCKDVETNNQIPFVTICNINTERIAEKRYRSPASDVDEVGGL